jgi:hypothetical protein
MKEFDFDSPRQVNLLPTNNPERYYKLLRLQDALRVSWSADTCAEWERDKWTPCLPSFGQCTVTAILIQEFFGGKMVKDPDNDHYWNIFDDGQECDMTRSQFPVGLEVYAKLERTREYMLESERAFAARTPERYKTLLTKVQKYMGLKKTY